MRRGRAAPGLRLGDQLLARRLGLLALLDDSKAEGFSTGFLDFVRDALPALILPAVALVFVRGENGRSGVRHQPVPRHQR